MISRRDVLGAAAALLATRRASAEQRVRAPVIFVSHAAPLFLPEQAARRAELGAWGARLVRPSGIIVMTPHFASRATEVGITGRGFAWYDLPPAMKRLLPQNLEYPTPPSEALAARIDALLGSAPERASGRRGFDHTTWMPLKCLFPAADVPVLEISYPYVPEKDAFTLGKRLAPLRDEGILFVASGGMTHNLAMGLQGPVSPFATEFDAWATEAMAKTDVDALIDWRKKAPAANLAHRTTAPIFASPS